MAENWELGSNYSVGINGFSGLQELATNLSKFVRDLDGPIMREALWKGAEVIKSAIEAATPVAEASGWGKNAHAPGQAKRSVIIYERGAKTYSQGQFYTSLSMSSFVEGVGSTNLLVGYEKKRAYYMYFVEHGYTRRRKGDIIIRTRATGGSKRTIAVGDRFHQRTRTTGTSVTKHFRPEDLFFPLRSSSKSTKGAWGKAQFGRAIAKMEATGGAGKVPAHPIPFNAEAAMQRALEAASLVLRNRIGMAA